MTGDSAPTTAQKIQDLALLITAGAVYALLVTVAALRPIDREDLTLILYATGGALELTGISTVALDLRTRRARWRRFQSGAGVVFAHRNRRLLTPTWPTTGDPNARIAALERGLRTQMDTLDREGTQRDALLIRLIGTAEPDATAWIGFITLLLGVLVGTAANIVSATG